MMIHGAVSRLSVPSLLPWQWRPAYSASPCSGQSRHAPLLPLGPPAPHDTRDSEREIRCTAIRCTTRRDQEISAPHPASQPARRVVAVSLARASDAVMAVHGGAAGAGGSAALRGSGQLAGSGGRGGWTE